jgi:hypothetical protein
MESEDGEDVKEVREKKRRATGPALPLIAEMRRQVSGSSKSTAAAGGAAILALVAGAVAGH